MNKTRASAFVALLITACGIAYAGGLAVTGWEPSSGWLIQAIIHIGELAVVLALASSGAGGRSRGARIGLAAAALGQSIIAAAEVIWPSNPDLANVLFGVAPILTGAGLISAGIAAMRARVWAGSARLLPLALGLYTILVLIPVMIGSGGPPAPLALGTIAVWDLLWFALSLTIVGRTRSAKPNNAAAAKVTVR